jgi:hypothetical protein
MTWDSWWANQVCVACEHFKERAGHLVAPRDRQWIVDYCHQCGGYWLCCRPCFERFEIEAAGRAGHPEERDECESRSCLEAAAGPLDVMSSSQEVRCP